MTRKKFIDEYTHLIQRAIALADNAHNYARQSRVDEKSLHGVAHTTRKRTA
jgi:hypothetical protein